MARDKAYREAEKKIEAARRSGATELDLSVKWDAPDDAKLTELPESIGQLTKLHILNLRNNRLTALPEALGQLTQLQSLNLSSNQLTALPEWLRKLSKLNSLFIQINCLDGIPDFIADLKHLKTLYYGKNENRIFPNTFPIWLRSLLELEDLGIGYTSIEALPTWINELTELKELQLPGNKIADLPASLAKLEYLKGLNLDGNPLNPELAAAYKEGLEAVKAYLRAKAGAQVVLNEAKLILVGEGEVGKSCLLAALRGDPFVEGLPTTHGIEIKPVQVIDPDSGREITLNGWDFGGQRVYRPTHQLFFSAPAVYLVVWKPREGPQQGFVKEWIRLIKHREPDAKILVVATHGGPMQRQPDIDRQELWDLFGKETVLDFFHVESKPDEKTGERKGIPELKDAIAKLAASLPEMGRSVPKVFQDVRTALQQDGVAYLPLERVLAICREHKMDDDTARLFVAISHRLGHLIHYEHDPALRDIVVLKPDWLATAISFVLDDEVTRKAHGLVSFSHLSTLWADPDRPAESRYPQSLHPIFLRLMERFDLSYRVAGLPVKTQADETSLIAQLVPDTRPEADLARVWSATPATNDLQQVQICRIVDDRGQSATAEGLFYQLIVRLHKYSLGRLNFCESVHWQRRLVLDDDYNGRALLEHIGNDVRITVRAPFPERFLAMLTEEVKYLVESFWEGLRCDVMVPCIEPCGKHAPGTGLFEVEKLIDSKRRGRPDYPCPVCNEWQNIEALLHNAPAARPVSPAALFETDVLAELRGLRSLLMAQRVETMGRFDNLDASQRALLSKADASYTGLMQALTDEAKDGPRLFSLVPIEPGFLGRPKWVNAKFRLTLWCEHSRLPLPALNKKGDTRGVYDLNLPRKWLVEATPYLKLLTGTLSLVLPVASSAIKLALDDAAYKRIEEELDLGKDSIEAVMKGGEKAGEWLAKKDDSSLEPGTAIRAQGAVLRQLHTWLKEKDPGFGGLVRVLNKRQEFLWVHEQFEKEY
jgi:internalin A